MLYAMVSRPYLHEFDIVTFFYAFIIIRKYFFLANCKEFKFEGFLYDGIWVIWSITMFFSSMSVRETLVHCGFLVLRFFFIIIYEDLKFLMLKMEFMSR